MEKIVPIIDDGQEIVVNLEDKKTEVDEILVRSNEFAKSLATHINKKVEEENRPIPLAVILNACMFIYASTVTNSVPKGQRAAMVADHFERVLKDIENGEKYVE